MAGFFEPALNEGAAEADVDAEAMISISGSDSTEMIRAVAKFIASQEHEHLRSSAAGAPDVDFEAILREKTAGDDSWSFLRGAGSGAEVYMRALEAERAAAPST